MKSYNLSQEQIEKVTNIANEMISGYYEKKNTCGYNRMSKAKKLVVFKKLKLVLFSELVQTGNCLGIRPWDYLWVLDTVSHMSPEDVEEERIRSNKQLLPYEGYPEISKQEEIDLLYKLCATNGYFADKFRAHFEQMANNIKNDMDIMLGIELD